jgi:diaminohydroxyphosphoribosylaminopyrimidine deaminase/5-amino-6-(5-phosphoribosylamino)uracil reductase
VFVGAVDADPRNRHRARRVLGRYGIPVFLMDYRERHRALNRVFLFHQENRIPYVQLKAGQTLDGALSDRFGKSKWITGERAREAGRLLRMHADSVLVGADTLNRDDPALDVRMPPSPGWRDPARVILSGSGELNVGARLLRRESSSPVWVLTSREGARRLDGRIRNPRCRVAAFRSGRNNRIPLKRCLTYLKQRGYHNLLVEGGADLLTGFLKTRLFNELHLFVAPRIFGGGSLRPGGNEPLAGVRSRDALQLLETRQYENDVYLRYLNVYRHH